MNPQSETSPFFTEEGRRWAVFAVALDTYIFNRRQDAERTTVEDAAHIFILAARLSQTAHAVGPGSLTVDSIGALLDRLQFSVEPATDGGPDYVGEMETDESVTARIVVSVMHGMQLRQGIEQICAMTPQELKDAALSFASPTLPPPANSNAIA